VELERGITNPTQRIGQELSLQAQMSSKAMEGVGQWMSWFEHFPAGRNAFYGSITDCRWWILVRAEKQAGSWMFYHSQAYSIANPKTNYVDFLESTPNGFVQLAALMATAHREMPRTED